MPSRLAGILQTSHPKAKTGSSGSSSQSPLKSGSESSSSPKKNAAGVGSSRRRAWLDKLALKQHLYLFQMS